jgi:predicted lipid-binding transport protein (Tim44 family)
LSLAPMLRRPACAAAAHMWVQPLQVATRVVGHCARRGASSGAASALRPAPAARWRLSQLGAVGRGLSTKPEGGGGGGGGGENAVAVQNSLTVVEQAEWEKKWRKFKESAFQSRIFEHVNDASERIDDFIEDSDNIFVRGVRRMKHAIFAETEEAMALKEIKRLDPSWTGPQAFLDWLEGDVLEKWVESFLKGDAEGIEFMSTVCTERAMMMAVATFKQRETIAPGCRLDERVLMIEDVEYDTAALMDEGPVLIVNFAAQGIECFWNKDNEVVHGDEDNIEKTYYRWAMQLDTDVEEMPAQWKLAEWHIRAKQPLAM